MARHYGCDVLGLDASPTMIAIANEYRYCIHLPIVAFTIDILLAFPQHWYQMNLKLN